MEHEFKLENSKLKSKNNKDCMSSDNLDNDMMKHEFELQNGKHESKHKKYSTLRNNVNNDNNDTNWSYRTVTLNQRRRDIIFLGII